MFHFWESFTAKKVWKKIQQIFAILASKARQFPPLNCSGEPFQPHAQQRMRTDIDRLQKIGKTRSSWLNCALRDDEAVYWVSIGHNEAVAVGN